MLRHRRIATVLLTVLFVGQAPFAIAQSLGNGGGAVSGSAGPDGASGENELAEKCTEPKGTIAVNEPQSSVMTYLTSLGLTSPLPLLRLIIQQSNCFQVVERGRAMQNIMQERELAGLGELQSTSNLGKGQLVVADFVLTPDVAVSSENSGGAGAAIGGLFGGIGSALGGGIRSKSKTAQTSILVSDTRSGIQVAAATGSAKKRDISFFGLGGGGGVGGALGAYQNTPQGQVIAASFLDNWNEVVRSIRNQDLLVAPTSASSQRNAAVSLQANPFNAGDVLAAKIAGVKLLSQPQEGAAPIASLAKTDEMVYDGSEQNGYLKVVTSKGSGWVRTVLVQKL